MSGPQVSAAELKHSDLPVLLAIGDLNRAEMRPLVNWLKEQVVPSSGQIECPECADQSSGQRRLLEASDLIGICFPNIAVALNSSQSNVYPDLIVVLQNWSNEYSRADVNRLFAFAPLARIVVCYGAWCESDGRNQNIWPQSVRVPVWAAQSRIEREFRLIQNPGKSTPLPWSASREEIFAADHPSIMMMTNPQSFLIDSPDDAYRRSVIEIMTAAGHQLIGERPALLLFDADPWGPARMAVLKTLRDHHPIAFVVGLMHLAQPSEIAELRDLGVTKVIRKLGFGATISKEL